MEEIQTRLGKQFELINRIEVFLDLHACKSHILPQLNELHLCSRQGSAAVGGAKKALEIFRREIGPKYATVIRKMRRNELLLLDLLEQLETSGGSKVIQDKNDNVEGGTLSSKQMQSNPGHGLSLMTAEKIFLSEYQNSPFVTKMKPRCLSFLDFNIDILEEDFQQIPKYMRGRETLDELAEFLKSVILSCFEEKYSLMYKQKKAVTSQQDLALWKIYNQQQDVFPNSKFITQGDIARKMGRLIDKKINVKLQMLRHLHILQETRNGGTVYYLWIRG
ncbi:uncharacterized protein LOC129768800 [Toxorhynchites rutilus septentrionalis]|uniref:uncharacterized protein LOC129768800 n=1 Tax=Toxorhynchites rutilus septentrionalis TaxID=329112 RepID=UPI00247911F1|nr:uncharacterized protein LOC129768800 [Toxorhynchites rutilus septentrionalis]